MELCNFDGHLGGTSSVWIGRRTCKWIASGGKDRTVKLWSLKSRHAQLTLQGHSDAISKVVFNNEEETILAATTDGAIKLWDMQAGKGRGRLSGHSLECLDAAFHPFGEFCGSGGRDNTVKLWDFRQQICIHTYSGHVAAISAVQFSPDGRLLVSGSHDGVVKVWDLTAAKLMKSFNCHTGQITGLEYHPHEHLLAASCSDGDLFFWDLDNFAMVGDPAHLSTGIQSIAYAKNGMALHTVTIEEVTSWSWEPTTQLQTWFHRWDNVVDLVPQKENQMVVANVQDDRIMVVLADVLDTNVQVDGESQRDGPRYISKEVNDPSATVLEHAGSLTICTSHLKVPKRSTQKDSKGRASEQGREMRAPKKSAYIVETSTTPQKPAKQAFTSVGGRTESGKSASTSAPSKAKIVLQRLQLHDSGISQQDSNAQNTRAPDQQGIKLNDTRAKPAEDCQKPDCSLINKMMDGHNALVETLSGRQCHLQVASTFWKRRDVRGTLSSIKRCADPSVTHDVLTAVGKEYYFKLDHCPQVVALLIPLLESGEAHFRTTAIAVAASLLQCHNQVIRNHLSCTYERARDLAFAERLDSCTAARNALRSILPHVDGSSHSPRALADPVPVPSTTLGVTGRLVQELKSL
eukprot:jgi/Botrbrau1/12024/Bobra.0293s0001.1